MGMVWYCQHKKKTESKPAEKPVEQKVEIADKDEKEVPVAKQVELVAPVVKHRGRPRKS